MALDPMDRTAKIKVQWKDGRWQLCGGGELPELLPDTVADLILPVFSIVGDQQRQQWGRSVLVRFIEAGTNLFAQIKPSYLPEELTNSTVQLTDDHGVPGRFIPFAVEEDVFLTLVAGKKGKLSRGKCRIPCLQNVETLSINEAYSKIARKYEPSRRSDTGNVFEMVYVRLSDDVVVRLNTLREYHESIDHSLLRAHGWNDLLKHCDEDHTKWPYELRLTIIERIIEMNASNRQKRASRQMKLFE